MPAKKSKRKKTTASSGKAGAKRDDAVRTRVKVERQSESDQSDSEKSVDSVSTDKSAIKLYLKDIGQISLLTPQEEIELARLILAGDEEARSKMIQANLRLVVKIAHDYSNFGLPLLDLISEGNIGLIKAVERFDPEKGGKLSTYAAWWIKQSIKRALANQSKTIRLPVHLVDKIARMRKVTNRLSEVLGRDPSDEEIADELEMPVNKVAHLKTVSARPTSLDAPVGDAEGTELGQLVGDERAINPLENLHSKSLIRDINRIVDHLDKREAEIIRLRFGLGGEKQKTLEEVGEIFSITRERVRQLQNMALGKMRKIMAQKDHQRTSQEISQEQTEKERMQVLQEFYAAKGLRPPGAG